MARASMSIEEIMQISRELKNISVQIKNLNHRALDDMEKLVTPFFSSMTSEFLKKANTFHIEEYADFLDIYSKYIEQACICCGPSENTESILADFK